MTNNPEMSETPNVEKEESVFEVAKSKFSTSKKVFLYGFFGLLGAFLILSVVFGVYRVYAKTGTDGFTVSVARTLRLPIAKVNGKAILYSDYIDDLNAIKTMRDFDKKNSGAAANLTDENLSDQVLFRQVNNILVGELAKKEGVALEQKDVDDVKNNILVQQFGSLDKAEEAIKERYGWTLAEFENKVIKQFVIQNKLAEKITTDTNAKAEVKKNAESVLEEIKKGADFAQMATKYGSDGTSTRGGDLGWFGKGDMVPEFENAAFSLKKGELSPSLVETQFGYHIVQTMDKKTEKVKDDKGKTVNKETVQARHILFALPSLDRILNNELKSIIDSIHIYGKVNNPFKELDKAEEVGTVQQ